MPRFNCIAADLGLRAVGREREREGLGDEMGVFECAYDLGSVYH